MRNPISFILTEFSYQSELVLVFAGDIFVVILFKFFPYSHLIYSVYTVHVKAVRVVRRLYRLLVVEGYRDVYFVHRFALNLFLKP